eukprot:CAMPEP_0202873268 /NCGR_PEP_ID=MMETSP1391-20130828/22948_1 /ASSEMBLY_ACC=CAM_ASM_000867 /TAXON_ID=1034604 /ORGANISM="Chlamydomonas leiostraca, Strain SAG 11-49" /LENGTH=71 /DNA_ID=CAMNT_0049554459 /DNA_START=23 /DNA_END=235 /DNA_ORIENTATION=+
MSLVARCPELICTCGLPYFLPGMDDLREGERRSSSSAAAATSALSGPPPPATRLLTLEARDTAALAAPDEP